METAPVCPFEENVSSENSEHQFYHVCHDFICFLKHYIFDQAHLPLVFVFLQTFTLTLLLCQHIIGPELMQTLDISKSTI